MGFYIGIGTKLEGSGKKKHPVVLQNQKGDMPQKLVYDEILLHLNIAKMHYKIPSLFQFFYFVISFCDISTP